MSVWVAHQPLSAEEEAALPQRPYIILPWKELPDLSPIHSREGLRSLLLMLGPEAPPESINGKLEAVWSLLKNMEPEDLVVVPLLKSKKILIGEVTGGYRYVSEEQHHTIPVRWLDAPVPMLRLGRMAASLQDTSRGVYEVEDPQLRTRLRDAVPLGYNRFRKFKWLLGIALLMQAAHMLQRLFE